MNSRLTRRVSAAIGGAAILAMIGFTAACGTEEKKSPETSTTTTTTTTTAPSVEPTEKSISPSGGNKFTPTVKAPPAPTAIPGDN
ncbi:hypothetical protein [Mycolicibacterium cosmeticum]|jgi:hypothetical protein|uniref:Uncharacterized protein n=1 Tax=Mycolicibacterium cosmeticum TaxID=258533 RepID=W9B4B1_MYCCO|nr:hypothetical protein [Mycolicibacterium cosmeticum]CDO09917.1 hypothetical protein BN977_04745 [Mycolicibacterium cosmeticum]